MEEQRKYSLVIVDMQYDFYDPNGSMYVPGAEKLVDKMVEHIEKNHDQIFEVIFTVDWHLVNHRSFIEQGGEWPMHCVQYTRGASLPNELIEVCNKYSIPTSVIQKGHVHEEYGAFDHMTHICQVPENHISFELDAGVITDSDYYVVCGLCGDYCVLESIKNLRAFNEYCEDLDENITVDVAALPHLIASIDDGEKFNEYVKESGLTLLDD